MLKVQQQLIKTIEQRARDLLDLSLWQEANKRMEAYFVERCSYSRENVERMEREEIAAQLYFKCHPEER